MGLRALGTGLRRTFTISSAARLIRNPAIAETRLRRSPTNAPLGVCRLHSVRFSLHKAATAATSVSASAGFVTTLCSGHAASKCDPGRCCAFHGEDAAVSAAVAALGLCGGAGAHWPAWAHQERYGDGRRSQLVPSIHSFIDVHFVRLRKFFRLKWRRTPAYTTIRNILRQLDPASVEQAFRRHAAILDEQSTPPGQRHIAVDGKASTPSWTARPRIFSARLHRARSCCWRISTAMKSPTKSRRSRLCCANSGSSRLC